jgi:hypothetical protein
VDRRSKRRGMAIDASAERGGGWRWVRCACGKRGFRDKATARRISRAMRRGDPWSETLGVYRCAEYNDPPLWHVGHKNPRERAVNLNDSPSQPLNDDPV